MTALSEVRELVRLAEKATPGPWSVFADGGLPLKVIGPPGLGWHGDVCKVSVRPEIYGDGAWDADFIAAARNSVPSLLALLSRLEAAEEWIADADHHPGCSGAFPPHPCKCGLSALRASLHPKEPSK